MRVTKLFVTLLSTASTFALATPAEHDRRAVCSNANIDKAISTFSQAFDSALGTLLVAEPNPDDFVGTLSVLLDNFAGTVSVLLDNLVKALEGL